MSDIRIPDVSYTRTIARENGKIKHGPRKSERYEIFGAYQFSMRLDGANFSSSVPVRKSARTEFYNTMFRLRVNGKWYGDKRYQFFTMAECMAIIEVWRG